jgi:hypothetical protein
MSGEHAVAGRVASGKAQSWDRDGRLDGRGTGWENPVSPPYSTEDLAGRFVDGAPSWLQAKEGGAMDRTSRIASRMTAAMEENMGVLREAVVEAARVPGVEGATLWDNAWDGSSGVIEVSLPVREWAGTGYPDPKVPMAFVVDPRSVARRVGDRVRALGLKVMSVRLPAAAKGMFGGFHGYDMGALRVEVAVA